jgi:hypothetical protein
MHFEKFSLDLVILKLMTLLTDVLKASQISILDHDLCFFCRHLYQFHVMIVSDLILLMSFGLIYMVHE